MKRKLRQKIKVSEADIKEQVKDYLYIKGWFHFPLTAGLGSYRGLPDRIAVKNGRVLFLEIKKPGGKQRPEQIDFEQNIAYQKGEYYLIDCLESLIKAIG